MNTVFEFVFIVMYLSISSPQKANILHMTVGVYSVLSTNFVPTTSCPTKGCDSSSLVKTTPADVFESVISGQILSRSLSNSKHCLSNHTGSPLS